MADESVTEPEEGRYLLLKEAYYGAGYRVERYLTPEEVVRAYAERDIYNSNYSNYIVARELRPRTTLEEW